MEEREDGTQLRASFGHREIRDSDTALIAAGAPSSTLFPPPYGKKLVG